MTINQTAISGNLVRDAELRNTTTGAVLRFTVASNEWRKDAEQHTNYFDCVMFGARGAIPDKRNEGRYRRAVALFLIHGERRRQAFAR